MWIISVLAAMAGVLARFLGFSKFKAGRKVGQTEVRLESAEQEIKARQAQAQAVADAGRAADPGALADELRREGRF
jgi:hypothetical protein